MAILIGPESDIVELTSRSLQKRYSIAGSKLWLKRVAVGHDSRSTTGPCQDYSHAAIVAVHLLEEIKKGRYVYTITAQAIRGSARENTSARMNRIDNSDRGPTCYSDRRTSIRMGGGAQRKSKR